MKKGICLSGALSSFLEAHWLPFKDSMNSLKDSIKRGLIDIDILRKDFNDVMEDDSFNWVEFANESQLLIAPEHYNDIEIKNYVKALLMDFLFPEKAISEEERKMLIQNVELLLKNHTENGGWMFSYDIFNRLKESEAYKNLEYYHLYNARNEYIERKYENDFKQVELGFWRYNQ